MFRVGGQAESVYFALALIFLRFRFNLWRRKKKEIINHPPIYLNTSDWEILWVSKFAPSIQKNINSPNFQLQINNRTLSSHLFPSTANPDLLHVVYTIGIENGLHCTKVYCNCHTKVCLSIYSVNSILVYRYNILLLRICTLG